MLRRTHAILTVALGVCVAGSSLIFLHMRQASKTDDKLAVEYTVVGGIAGKVYDRSIFATESYLAVNPSPTSSASVWTVEGRHLRWALHEIDRRTNGTGPGSRRDPRLFDGSIATLVINNGTVNRRLVVYESADGDGSYQQVESLVKRLKAVGQASTKESATKPAH